jgi:two-component system, OmpR family, response regulator
MTQPQRILVVDNDPDVRLMLGDHLAQAGYQVDTAQNATAMWQLIAHSQPTLIVLDITLPDEDGLALCRRLQAHGRPAVIVLGALDAPTERITTLEMGADDYVAKPVDPRQLLARIRALLRRMQAQNDAPGHLSPLDFDGWKLDRRRAQLISPRAQVIALGRTDYQVLCALLDHVNCEVSREYLVEHIFQKNYLPSDRAIDMSISRLRRHLEKNSTHPQLIRTVRHVGYMLTAKVEPA